jgi:hypothetical protein
MAMEAADGDGGWLGGGLWRRESERGETAGAVE